MLLLHFLRLTIDTSAHAPRSLRTNCTGTSWALVHSLPVPQLGQNEADPEASIHLLTCRDSDFGTWWIGTFAKARLNGSAGSCWQQPATLRTGENTSTGPCWSVRHSHADYLSWNMRNSRWTTSQFDPMAWLLFWTSLEQALRFGTFWWNCVVQTSQKATQKAGPWWVPI